MALISTNNLQTILDKLARFASESVGDPEFAEGFNAGMELASSHVLSGSGGLATFILALDEEDQVADLLPAARDLDRTHPTPPSSFMLSIKEIASMLTALDNHAKRFGYTSLDNLLSNLNASTPTLRAHGFFRRYLGKLSPANSFIPADLALAQLTLTGATTGTYAHLAKIDKAQYAGAKLVVKNVGVISDTTGVTVQAVKLDGTSTTLTASVSVLTDGHETDLSETAKLFVDVTSIAVTGGTDGDVIKVVAKTDRSVASA